ncbi:hypothetical protein [Gallaecimonas xiamenensis]|uniref:hypothetical protein n=1 Tax=Gallaecimonas xiamenensis TaxID=1207039 RepID=UPI0012EA5D0E|nr:hypothetical protein [Gallaecimonas xiamenensis]
MNIKEKLEELKNIPCPVQFKGLPENGTLEIQCFTKDNELSCSHGGTKYLIFAVTTDGWDLLIESDSSEGVIFQREMDDIDTIGITIKQLLEAHNVTL